MPPRVNSRKMFCTAQADASGRLFLSERSRFLYRSLSDNIMHTVAAGESLFTIAARYYAAVDRPAGLWWVIADFQPDPIFDPTLRIADGTVLVVPSLQTVLTLVFAEERRAEEPI